MTVLIVDAEGAAAQAQLEKDGAHERAKRDALITPEYRLADSVTSTLGLDVSQTYRTSGRLNPRQIDIVELDATALAHAIASRAYTSVEVAEAYALACALAQQTTNCLAWFNPKEALQRAQWLDDELSKTGKPVGRLHGVPVSIKDFCAIKGWPQSFGTVSTAGVVPTDDSAVVQILRAEGANFVATTSMPQVVMHLETDSYLGITTNPYNRNLTPGGSSGGESALIASHGSPLGVGGDVGGSIRAPCAFTGLWGFKPSAYRVSKRGQYVIMRGADGVLGALGPMARSYRDLDLFMQVMSDAAPWYVDRNMPPLPWNPSSIRWASGGSKIRIGVIWDDGVVRPVKAIRTALQQTVRALERLPQIELVDFEVTEQAERTTLTRCLYLPDGGAKLKVAMKGETILPSTQKRIDETKALTVAEYWELVMKRDAYRAQWADRMRKEGLDVLLAPVNATPSFLHKTSFYTAYCHMFNLLDWPAGAFPTGHHVGPDDAEDTFQPRNATEELAYRHYDVDRFHNAPVGLQIAGPRWEDEKVMAVLSIVAKGLEGGTA